MSPVVKLPPDDAVHGTVYISGPMTGIPESNYPAFNEAAERWRAAGWEVLNPAENFGGRSDLDYATYIREDMKMLMRADTIAMLPGWRFSKGAKWELHTAQLLGLRAVWAETQREIRDVVKTHLTGPDAASVLG